MPFRAGDIVRARDGQIDSLVTKGSAYKVNKVHPNATNLLQLVGKGEYWFHDNRFDLVEDMKTTHAALLREFNTGATRNLDKSKLDYEGFLSPLALEAFAKYMHSHRQQKDGTFRDSDNWQKGIPQDVYVKSLFRHFFDLWSLHRGGTPISPDSGLQVDRVEALCAMMFNVQGLLHELLKEQSDGR